MVSKNKLLIISDSSTLHLENIARLSDIETTKVLDFPSQLNDSIIKQPQNILILLSEVFYKNLLIRSPSNNIIEANLNQTFLILDKLIETLSKSAGYIFIPLIPKHFLFLDMFNSYYLDKISNDNYFNLINSRLYSNYNKYNNVVFLRGIEYFSDKNSKEYFRFSSIYSKNNSQIIVNQIKKYMENQLKNKKKLIVLDLDNTLWDGVIGDDMKDGIRMDKSDSVGSIYYQVQKILLKFKDNGFLLAICSKNEENVALDALFNHPSSQFTENDIVSHRINWKNKSCNIKDICRELNISTNETIFIDDSSHECEEVLKNADGVTVIQVPKNKYNYPFTLSHNNIFDNNTLTEEDKNRTNFYRAKVARENLLDETIKTKGTKVDWLKSLNTILTYKKLTSDSIYFDRVIKLFNRTNQFHLSSNRYNNNSLKLLLEKKDIVYYHGFVSDSLGDEGLVSVLGYEIIKEKLIVKDYIMSCRVFGRGLEESMLLPIFSLALKYNLEITFEFKNSGRNKVIDTFLRKICQENYIITKNNLNTLRDEYLSLPVKVSAFDEISDISI